MVVVGIILYIFELKWRRSHKSQESDKDVAYHDTTSDKPSGQANSAEDETAISVSIEEASEECCGLHLVCEKDSLSPMSADIIYYDDEELDRFVGRTPESYSPEEEEEFREVLMTLRPDDVAGWARSITQRHLELPPDVRDELLMLVNEQRNSPAKK